MSYFGQADTLLKSRPTHLSIELRNKPSRKKYMQCTAVFPRIRIQWVWIRIRIQHFRLNTDTDPGFWWPKIGKNLQVKNTIFFEQILQFTYASIKTVQAKGEAFIPQKRTSSTSKHEISKLFIFLWVRIPIPDPLNRWNPDPEHWCTGGSQIFFGKLGVLCWTRKAYSVAALPRCGGGGQNTYFGLLQI
jgi:hypothetical protein